MSKPRRMRFLCPVCCTYVKNILAHFQKDHPKYKIPSVLPRPKGGRSKGSAKIQSSLGNIMRDPTLTGSAEFPYQGGRVDSDRRRH